MNTKISITAKTMWIMRLKSKLFGIFMQLFTVLYIKNATENNNIAILYVFGDDIAHSQSGKTIAMPTKTHKATRKRTFKAEKTVCLSSFTILLSIIYIIVKISK